MLPKKPKDQLRNECALASKKKDGKEYYLVTIEMIRSSPYNGDENAFETTAFGSNQPLDREGLTAHLKTWIPND